MILSKGLVSSMLSCVRFINVCYVVLLDCDLFAREIQKCFFRQTFLHFSVGSVYVVVISKVCIDSISMVSCSPFVFRFSSCHIRFANRPLLVFTSSFLKKKVRKQFISSCRCTSLKNQVLTQSGFQAASGSPSNSFSVSYHYSQW